MRENSELGQKSFFAKVAISRKHLFSDRLAKNGSVSESSSHDLLIGLTLWVLEKKNFDSSLIGGRKKIISQRKFIGFQKNWYGWASLEQLRQSNLKDDIA